MKKLKQSKEEKQRSKKEDQLFKQYRDKALKIEKKMDNIDFKLDHCMLDRLEYKMFGKDYDRKACKELKQRFNQLEEEDKKLDLEYEQQKQNLDAFMNGRNHL